MNLDKEISKAEIRLHKLKSQKAAQLSRKRVPCYECSKQLTIGKLVYYIEEFYISPTGCTGGDYYTSDDSEHFYVCPHCSVRSRLFDRPDLRKLKANFKTIEYVKDEEVRDKWPRFINLPPKGKS